MAAESTRRQHGVAVPAGSGGMAPAPVLEFYTSCRAALARLCIGVGVAGLILLIVAVLAQVFGRHVLNDTLTWAESIWLILVLYVTMLGAAVGVRDSGHIGFEVMVQALPKPNGASSRS